MRSFMLTADQFDTQALLTEWRWLVPPEFTPIMISMFGDWVLGAPNGSLWALSVLDGSLACVAATAADFNARKANFAWLDQVFMAGWQEIAERQGLIPAAEECVGWTVHPQLGGRLEPANLAVFSMRLYQALMGQLHRHIRRSGGG